MKKLITSASLVALGAATVDAAVAPSASWLSPGLTPVQTAKPWSVAASLRGFYDDNYLTVPSSFPTVDAAGNLATGHPRSSWGFEVSPSIAVNENLEQTYIGASYVYGLFWYADRVNNSADHTHQADVKLSHAFTEHYKIDADDTFVLAQEPEILEPGAVITFPLRANGNNFRNTGQATFTGDLTDKLSTVLGYSNNLYDYEQSGPGSYSALLDRMEHLITADLRWQLLPTTVGLLGYQYGVVDYTSRNSLDPFAYINPEIRDNDSHYVYLGVDQSITSQLTASARVGAQFTEYYNHDKVMEYSAVPLSIPDSTVSPYADASLTYTYMQNSYVQVGVRHARNQTDVAFTFANPNPTLDAESTTVYGSVNQQIFGGFMASVLGQYQHSVYEGGGANGLADDFYLVGLNLSYEINKFLAAEAGYDYDRLDSSLPVRAYDRNRVYFGIRASY